jgi:hypothetical protein
MKPRYCRDSIATKNSKLNLENYGTSDVPSKYVNIFGKYFQLTKVDIISHKIFNFELFLV